MARTPTGRRRGGQPGNHNRLKHGLYSRRSSFYGNFDNAASSAPTRPDQLAFARARLKNLIQQQMTASHRDWLAYERAILNYLTMIIGLHFRRRRRALDGSFFSDAADRLRQLREAGLLDDEDDSNLIGTSGLNAET